MPKLNGFLKVFLWSLGAWAATIAFYVVAFVIAIVVTDAGRARLSTVETVVAVLEVAQVGVGCLAIAFVYFVTRRYFQLGMRIVWTVIYTVIQLATTALLAITLLIMFNR